MPDQPTRMPIRTSKEAPRFQGVASTLERYLEDIEMICEDRERSGDAELIKWAIYYTDEKSSETWTTTRDALTSPKTWADFRTAISEIYPEAQPDRRHTIAALRIITDRYSSQAITSEAKLAEYHREFSATAQYLMKKHRITSREASVMYMSAFASEIRPDITTRLTIKCPDVRPDDGYDLKEMNSAAQFVISSRPAIALLADTTPRTPTPAPAPTPMPATPPPPTPAPITQAQAFAQRPIFNGCVFCGESDHRTPWCRVRDEYVKQGKIKLSDGRIQLPNGEEPNLPKYRGDGQWFKQRVDKWHQNNPQPNTSEPRVASANLLEVPDHAEIYAAEQKKNTTAMPRSKQTPPVPPPPPAASSSKGKEKETPAFKFRSPIDDATAAQRIIDHLLSLPVTLAAKDLIAISPAVQKDLRSLVTAKRVDTASSNEVSISDADTPDEDAAEVLMATTKPIETLRVVDGTFNGTVKCECVVDNGSQIIVIRKDKWERTGSGYSASRRIMMETANGTSNWTLGITENLTLTIGGLPVQVQAYIVEDAPYEVLLGRPFFTLLSAVTRDYPNGNQDITITCPESRTSAVLVTRPRASRTTCGAHSVKTGF